MNTRDPACCGTCAAIEAITAAYRRSPECSTDSVFGEAMLDHLRAQGFDVTARAEQ